MAMPKLPLKRRALVLLVFVAAWATACDRNDNSADSVGPGPHGSVPSASGLAITAPQKVRTGATFRVDIQAPVHTKTAYVYWQSGDARYWTTFGFTTGEPGSPRKPAFIRYPVPKPFPVESNAIYPETNSDPTFETTVAPARPGRYRIIKSLVPLDAEPVWVATEITVS